MGHLLRLYLGLAYIAAIRKWKALLRNVGERLKRYGRVLVARGEDIAPRWNLETFLRCFRADAEFHIGTAVYRGPLYAMDYGFFNKEDFLRFKLNWVAERSAFGGQWEYRGFCVFRLRECSSPRSLEGGDIWFSFPGGYGVLFLGKATERLKWKGAKDTPRVYTWF